MRQIYKFPITPHTVSVDIPEGSQILDVQVQRGEVMLWALVDLERKLETRRIVVLATGQETPSGPRLIHLGTVQLLSGDLVFHVFEQVKNPC